MDVIAGFVLVVVAVTAMLSVCIRSSAITVSGAVVLSVTGLQALNYFNVGYLDPFFIIAAMVQTAIALAAAGLTIVLSKALKEKAEKTKSE